MTGTLSIRCIAGAAAMLFLAPLVLLFFRPRGIRSWFEAGPEGIDRVALSPVRDVIATLRELGFQALGVKVEKSPLWPAIRDFAFVAGDGRCYASVAGNRARARVYYDTPLPAGGLVLTSNGAFPAIDSARVKQLSHPGCGARELLGRHYEALASIGQRGEVVPAAAARVEAAYAYYSAPEIRSALRRKGAKVLLFIVLAGWWAFS